MTVKEFLELAQIRANHSVIFEHKDAMIHFLNMALGELYNRFNLSVKSETVVTTKDLALYELRSADVQLILSVYDKFGRELEQSDVRNSVSYDYKLINYRTILVRQPVETYLYVIYKASPIVLKDESDIILIPDAMINAMLIYFSYLANDTINRDNKNEASMLIQLFEKQCQELINQGYQIPLNTETYSIHLKGYA